ncbi:conserved hypothetical protein [Ricinus communis]|uniref:Uncharacterized protein n=1 Tax=Ricinus communis TaxID=3988 RepID=B9RUX3_RICCO|nr:conserved hypothetical protein [Ricinus communis]
MELTSKVKSYSARFWWKHLHLEVLSNWRKKKGLSQVVFEGDVATTCSSFR